MKTNFQLCSEIAAHPNMIICPGWVPLEVLDDCDETDIGLAHDDEIEGTGYLMSMLARAEEQDASRTQCFAVQCMKVEDLRDPYGTAACIGEPTPDAVKK